MRTTSVHGSWCLLDNRSWPSSTLPTSPFLANFRCADKPVRGCSIGGNRLLHSATTIIGITLASSPDGMAETEGDSTRIRPLVSRRSARNHSRAIYYSRDENDHAFMTEFLDKRHPQAPDRRGRSGSSCRKPYDCLRLISPARLAMAMVAEAYTSQLSKAVTCTKVRGAPW